MDFKTYVKLKNIFTKDKDKMGIYRHYKGKEYEVIDLAFHTETGDVLVLYKQRDTNAAIFARPYHIFFSISSSGERRFTKVD